MIQANSSMPAWQFPTIYRQRTYNLVFASINVAFPQALTAAFTQIPLEFTLYLQRSGWHIEALPQVTNVS